MTMPPSKLPSSKLPPLASMTTVVCSSTATSRAYNAAISIAADEANIATIGNDGNAGIITRFATATPSPISTLLTWRTFLC
jgi:hypothetical protein